ncbi:hypothetical protein ABBQ32_010691 [Trebouxia sp. C0010 RCD-2024]
MQQAYAACHALTRPLALHPTEFSYLELHDSLAIALGDGMRRVSTGRRHTWPDAVTQVWNFFCLNTNGEILYQHML